MLAFPLLVWYLVCHLADTGTVGVAAGVFVDVVGVSGAVGLLTGGPRLRAAGVSPSLSKTKITPQDETMC